MQQGSFPIRERHSGSIFIRALSLVPKRFGNVESATASTATNCMAWREMKKPFFKLRDVWRLWRYRSKMRSGEYAGLLGNLVLSSHPETYSQWMPKDFSSLQKR